MAKYTDWYEVELDGYLKGRVPDVIRFEAIRELTSHFAEHTEELIAKGMDPIEAEKVAVKTFGHPRKAALNLMGEARTSGVGKWILNLSSIAIVLVVAYLTVFLYRSSLHYEYPENSVVGAILHYKVLVGLSSAVGILIALGTVLTRKLPLRQVVVSWVGALAVTSVVLLLIGKPTFAGIPDSEMPKLVTEWKEKNKVMFDLADTDSKIRKIISSRGYSATIPDRQTRLETISKLAPKLLGGQASGYVEVVGKDTSGYLVPTGSLGKNNMGYRFGADDQVFQSSDPFPFLIYQMKYVKDPSVALEAWEADNFPYFSARESIVQTVALSQFNFIASAEQIPAMSVWEMTFKSVGMVALGSGLYLAFFLLASFVLLLLTGLTFQSSFQRRIA